MLPRPGGLRPFPSARKNNKISTEFPNDPKVKLQMTVDVRESFAYILKEESSELNIFKI